MCLRECVYEQPPWNDVFPGSEVHERLTLNEKQDYTGEEGVFWAAREVHKSQLFVYRGWRCSSADGVVAGVTWVEIDK